MSTKRLSSPSPMTEEQLQVAVLQLAEISDYGIRYHNPDSRRSQAGFPDLVLGSLSRRRVLFRELKTDTGKVRPEQSACLDTLTFAGLDAGVWRPADLKSGRIIRELRGEA